MKSLHLIEKRMT